MVQGPAYFEKVIPEGCGVRPSGWVETVTRCNGARSISQQQQQQQQQQQEQEQQHMGKTQATSTSIKQHLNATSWFFSCVLWILETWKLGPKQAKKCGFKSSFKFVVKNSIVQYLPSTLICCISYQRPSTHCDKEPNLLVCTSFKDDSYFFFQQV